MTDLIGSVLMCFMRNINVFIKLCTITKESFYFYKRKYLLYEWIIGQSLLFERCTEFMTISAT